MHLSITHYSRTIANKLKSFFLIVTFNLLALLTIPAFADTLETFHKNSNEIEAIENWIFKEYPKAMSEQLASSTASHIVFTSASTGIPIDILVGLISIESGFRLKVKSREGALGLTQVMPKYHRKKLIGKNLFKPEDSIAVGATILNDCMLSAKQNLRGALKCYNGATGPKGNRYADIVVSKIREFKSFARYNYRMPFRLAIK